MPTTFELFPVRRVSDRDDVPQLPVLRAVWHDDPLIVLDGTVPYLVTPAARDPHRGADGRHLVPTAQLAQLRRLVDAGLQFDEIAIAHELDPDGPVSTLLPVLRSGPMTCSDEVARTVVGPVPEHPGVAKVVRALDRVAGGFSAAGSLVRAGAEAVLDPIVFGVIGLDPALRDGTPALWYPLAAWRW
ncbi:hypothetical protein EV652_12534 [Kribbella steppae]|uniref:Uncharacterized protein n=1 Tax=Kribbella steppae TaxID=2512223 RepID=A0A4R2GWW5_9ACTN|nr:hypothetical protein [Kribbella steppae]TCO13874.1 hypothetical protein EV652_12534 [Kribbella steppae]